MQGERAKQSVINPPILHFHKHSLFTRHLCHLIPAFTPHVEDITMSFVIWCINNLIWSQDYSTEGCYTVFFLLVVLVQR